MRTLAVTTVGIFVCAERLHRITSTPGWDGASRRPGWSPSRYTTDVRFGSRRLTAHADVWSIDAVRATAATGGGPQLVIGVGFQSAHDPCFSEKGQITLAARDGQITNQTADVVDAPETADLRRRRRRHHVVYLAYVSDARPNTCGGD
jgi:hypothetical protein